MGERHSLTQCHTCYYRQAALRRRDQVLTQLQRAWCRQAFNDFITHLLMSEVPDGKLSRRMARYAEFFKRLDIAFAFRLNLEAPLLFDLFGRAGLRKFAVPYHFLVDSGYVAPLPDEQLEDLTNRDAQERLLARVTEDWKRKLLERYLAHLAKTQAAYRKKGWTGKDERFAPRTITLLLRAAWKFLESLSAEVQSPQAIARDQLHQFVVKKPGHRNALHSFILYLNGQENLFQKLKIFRLRNQDFPDSQLLPIATSDALLKVWLNPLDGQLRDALLGLLMLVYARTAKQALQLRRGDFTVSQQGEVTVQFGNVPFALDETVAAILRRYLATLEAKRGSLLLMEDYIFPGKMPARPLDAGSVTYMLGKLGITAEQLFTTAIANCYRNGLTRPKVLVRTLGISTMTAISYWKVFAPRASEELAQRAGRR